MVLANPTHDPMMPSFSMAVLNQSVLYDAALTVSISALSEFDEVVTVSIWS
jgi:hypothetical protein